MLRGEGKKHGKKERFHRSSLSPTSILPIDSFQFLKSVNATGLATVARQRRASRAAARAEKSRGANTASMPVSFPPVNVAISARFAPYG